MSQLQVTGEAKIRDIQGPVVANDGVITALDGAASQYVRGDGTLASFPTVTGGGSSVSFYLNGSVNQGTFGGSTYYQLGEKAITGVGTNFSTSTNGLLAQFITDANVPDQTEIPSGNWNIEFYMGVSASSGALASFYVEIYKYDGTTFTLIGTNVATPEFLTNTTTIDAYFTSVAMPLTALNQTDRIAVRVFANVASKTVTLYTEDNRLCQVVTTFSRGLLSLNGLVDQQQYFAVGTSGTDFNIASLTDTHTFNIPSASATARGLITIGTQSIGGVKTFLNSTIQEGLSVLKNDAFQVIPSGYIALTGYGLGGLTILQGDGTNVYNTDLDFPNTSNRQYTFPDLSGTLALLEGTQTFTGANTFNNSVRNEYGTFIKQNQSDAVPSGYKGLFATTNGLEVTNSNTSSAFLNFNNAGNYTYTFPAITGTFALLEGSQTFSGAKSFSNSLSTGFIYGIGFAKGNTPTGIFSATNIYIYSEATSNNVVFQDDVSKAKLIFNNSTQTYTFPAASGTLALTSDLGAYVTLATTQTISGAKTFTALATNNEAIGIKLTSGVVSTGGYLTLNAKVVGTLHSLFLAPDSTTNRVEITFDNTALRTYALPNASGTIALTSNLSAYLPLAGGTLTGALSGTSATFSSKVTTTGPANDWGLVVNGSGTVGQSYGANIRGGSNSSDVAFLVSNYVGGDLLRVLGNGNVGIGTSSPSANLMINAGSGALTQDILIVKGGGSSGAYGFSVQANNGDKLLYTDNVSYNVIMGTTGGNVLIGTTSDTGIGKLQVRDAAIEVINSYYWLFNTGNSSRYGFLNNGSGSLVLNLYGTGNVGSFNMSTGVYTPLSNINAKKDFESSTIGLDAILRLKPTLYRMKTDETEGDKELGFIAQEVKEFIPQAYVESKDFIGLNYNAIVAALVKSVQEQQAQIEELKALNKLQNTQVKQQSLKITKLEELISKRK